jgi:hypothetical protein
LVPVGAGDACETDQMKTKIIGNDNRQTQILTKATPKIKVDEKALVYYYRWALEA